MPDSPGRADRMSAVGLTWEALIPKAASSCGVATYTGPDHWRPGAACCSPALVDSSAMTSCEPSAAPMLAAVAACACALPPAAGPPPPPLLGPAGPALGV